jgi:predicted anti-sigma-YlaC factor YlaD
VIGLLSRHADVERHFSGGGSSRADKRLFAHLKGCERCRDEYRTLAMLEQLEGGGGEKARARLARGIFEREPVRAARPRLYAGGFALGAACLALLVTVGQTPSPFRARGGASAASGAALAIYRVPRDQQNPEALAVGDTQRAGTTVRAGESLAFSYVSPPSVGACCLMVFGRDAAGRVYWFWPAWNDASEDPVSVPISEGNTPVELREAVRHPMQAGPLTIVGLFTPKPLHVREVEGAVAKGLEGLQAFEGHVWTETLEVTP